MTGADETTTSGTAPPAGHGPVDRPVGRPAPKRGKQWTVPCSFDEGLLVTLAERIDELVAQHGSLRAVARVTEIDAGYLSRLRAGEKVNPEKDKLRRLGLRRVVSYERLKPPNVRAKRGQTAQGEA